MKNQKTTPKIAIIMASDSDWHTFKPAEALNGIIQTVKRKARGFRIVEYFTVMIYLVSWHLKFNLPASPPRASHKTMLRS